MKIKSYIFVILTVFIANISYTNAMIPLADNSAYFNNLRSIGLEKCKTSYYILKKYPDILKDSTYTNLLNSGFASSEPAINKKAKIQLVNYTYNDVMCNITFKYKIGTASTKTKTYMHKWLFNINIVTDYLLNYDAVKNNTKIK